MSRNASIEFDWADGRYRFRLALGQIMELQEKTGCGPYFLLNRVIKGEWRVEDLRETIRLGLIGGGLDPSKALALVKRYVDDRPWAESMAPAQSILMAAVVGAPDGEKPGKSAAARARNGSLKTEGSPLPPSTATAP